LSLKNTQLAYNSHFIANCDWHEITFSQPAVRNTAHLRYPESAFCSGKLQLRVVTPPDVPPPSLAFSAKLMLAAPFDWQPSFFSVVSPCLVRLSNHRTRKLSNRTPSLYWNTTSVPCWLCMLRPARCFTFQRFDEGLRRTHRESDPARLFSHLDALRLGSQEEGVDR
jgi:hypothetical protein